MISSFPFTSVLSHLISSTVKAQEALLVIITNGGDQVLSDLVSELHVLVPLSLVIQHQLSHSGAMNSLLSKSDKCLQWVLQ